MVQFVFAKLKVSPWIPSYVQSTVLLVVELITELHILAIDNSNKGLLISQAQKGPVNIPGLFLFFNEIKVKHLALEIILC